MDSEYNSDAAQGEDVKNKGELNDGDNFATRDDQEQIRIRPELAEDMMHFHPKALLEVAQKFSRQYMDNRSETLVAQADFLIAVAAKKSSVLKGQAKGSAEHSTQTVEESVRAHGAMEEALKEGNSSQDRTPRGIEQPEDLPQGDHVDETKDTLPKSEEDIPYAGKNADDEDFGHAYFELGRAYISLVLRDHKMRFLPQAIATYRASLDHFNRFLEISGEDNPNRVRVLNNLAGAYQVQHDEMKDKQEDKKTPIDLAGLEQGIIYAREALALRAPGNTRRWESILTLGSLLGRLYVARPNQRLLDETTEIRREWLEEVPQGYEKRGPMMAEFASFIHDLDKSVFTIKLAQEAVDLMRAAFDLTPPGAEFPQYMNNLGTALDDLYQVSHDPTVADEAILIYQEALKLSPPDGMLYRSVLFNLANSYNHRWTQTKDLASLDACIKWRKALLANAPDHPDRGRIYQSLGAAHGNRFHKLHTLEDLEEGLRFFREALFVRDDKEERVETLFEISILLKDHYSLTNQPTSLDSSMRFLEEVLQARKPPHVAFCTVSNLFAEVLMIDAEKAGHDESRTRAIEICVRAVPHMQDTDVKRAHAILSLLGDALVKDYLVTRRLGALDEAIFTLRRLATMEGKKDGHVLRDLISALRLRVEETDDPADADAINRYSILLRETWKNSDDNGATIGDRHVVSLLYRAGKNANLDSEERQAILNSAKHYLERTPHGHRLHYLACVQYAMLLLDRQLGSYDFLQATKLITDAADAPVDSHRPAFEIIVPILEGIDAHLDEAEEKHDPGVDMIAWREAVLDAYIATIRLVPKVVYFGLDQRDQLPATQRARLIAVAAASHALALGKSRLSVELLEQGRAIFWNQALRLRAQDPDFIGVPSPIAVELKTILAELDALTHSPDEWIDQLTWPTWTRDSVAKARRQSVRAQQLIEEVRTRPGLERFLLGPSYDTMSTLAAEGHIIVLLLMHLHGSSQLPTAEAIVIAAPHQDPVRVFLPHVTYEKLSALSHELQKSNNEYRSGVAAEMEASRGLKVAHMPVPTETANVLQKLWMVIVKPIVDRLHLEKREGRNRPRLHWCPTGPFMSVPVHAARTKFESCSDYFVSSYTPTLSALVEARRNPRHIMREDIRVLLAATQNARGLPTLWSVHEEVAVVKSILPPSAILGEPDDDSHDVDIRSVEGTTVSLTDDMKDQQAREERARRKRNLEQRDDKYARDSTADVVLSQFALADIVHLACHGVADREDPLQSGFRLADNVIAIRDLMRLRLKKPLLAYLSACETARGLDMLSEEAFHLSSAMLFTGFSSVIGTLWTMNDIDGPTVAKSFYEELMKKDTIEFDDIPFALDLAIQTLRHTGVPPQRWATFVHMGA